MRRLMPLLVVVPLLGHFAVSLAAVPDDLYPWADHAVVQIETSRAGDGELLLGTYSRFRWNHPGPSLHYALAPLHELLGQDSAALNAGAALLNVVAALLIVLVAWRYGGRLTALWAAAVVGLLAIQLDVHVLRDYWFPHLVIFPFALYATLCAALATGARRLLPAVTALGSLLVQAQIGLTPVVAALAAAALAPLLVGSLRARAAPRPLWPYPATAAVLAAAWAAPVYEELTTSPGNFAQLRGFVGSTSGPHGAGDALDAVANMTSVAVLGSYNTFVHAVPARGGALLVLALLVAVLALGLAVALKRGRRFAAALCGLALVSLPVQWIATMNVRDELSAHVVFWFAGIGVPALLGAGAALAPRAGARVGELLLAAAVAAVTAIGIVEVADNSSIRWDPATGGDYAYDGRIEPLWRQVDAYTARRGTDELAVSIATKDRWLWAAGVIDQLRRHGRRVGVDPSWAFMFGDDLRIDGREEATLYFAAPGPPPPLPPRATVAASTPDVVVYATDGTFAAPSG